ncbi:peroxiredoxin family protein [Chondromyces apiculatus]|uniref:Periplasmic protein thiol:disulfide oxidoreductase, DsbE subfamily n=1 Tax=Chondromyces apiculatus DSM 436 TaxID=1192034 RepID=A0A017T452_9BACT|nr:TlpA disulfide reductase family protein [Chondromyces apiculatus]EYF03565.1 periplasmic protein thiol:disulfide oxidoreductase, DsbE subfamily [Chondromyces apiculatus DSM 436]
MRGKRSWQGVVLAAAAGALLAGCGGPKMPSSVRHPLMNTAAPVFEAEAMGTREVGVPGDYLTRVIVVDFWASWCAACTVSMPALDALFRERQADGVMVIGVSVDDSAGAAMRMARQTGTTFPIVMDPDQRLASEYGVSQVPLTFVIDGNGTVRWVGNDPGQARRAAEILLSEGRMPVLQ